MPVFVSASHFDPAALKALETLEVEYEEARTFRALLIPRLIVLTVAVLAVVVWTEVPWGAVATAIAIDAALIVFSVRNESRAKQRWITAATALATSLRLQPRMVNRTVLRRATAEDRDHRRASC